MRIGIDIGGSHIGVGLIDSNGIIIKLQERYINEKDSISIEEFIIKEIVSILNDWKYNENVIVDKIGIGAPGVIQRNEIVSSVNLGIKSFNITNELKKYFPTADIEVMNDAKCAALAEKKWGSLKEFDDCIFLCLGTGVGGAAFFDGKLVKPKRFAGFEVGHMIIEKDGIPCKCGSNGCFEQYSSMKKFKKTIRAILNLNDDVEGNKLREIINSNIDDDEVKKAIDEYVNYVSIGLANLVNILEPQAICLGGGFVKYESILFDKLKETFINSKDIFYKENIPELVIAKYGNDAGMIGSTLIFD